jgi:hypothetical protein
MFLRKFTLALLLLTSPAAFAGTYYISTTTGSPANCADSNAGTSKTAAWCHAPGMANATGTAAAHATAASDQYIFRGGETWSAASWPFEVDNGGACGTSAGNAPYIGVDVTWYTGASWARPIFSGGGTYPGTKTSFSSAMVELSYCPYAIVDSIEITGAYFNQGSTDVGMVDCNSGANCVGQEIKNLYIHGWSYGASATSDIGSAIFWYPEGTATASAHNNAIDGWDVVQPTCLGSSPCFSLTAFAGGPGILYQNYVHDVITFTDSNASGVVSVHDNTVNSLNCSWDNVTHANNIQYNVSPASGSTLYNNFFIHLGSCSFPLNLHAGSNSIYYIFNNVWVDVVNNLGISIGTLGAGNTTTTVNAFNNTIEPGADSGSGTSNPYFTVETDATAITYNIPNNHGITSASAPAVAYYPSGSCTGTNCTLTVTTPLLQSKTTASGQGYTLGQAYPFSPTSNSGGTVGAGTNETSLCNAISDATAKAACKNDTTLGVAEVSGSGGYVVSYPNRATVARPSSNPFDIGAYQFVGTATAPSCTPGTGTYAVAQTVTCTNPNSGTTVMCYATGATIPVTAGDGATCSTGTKYTTALTVSSSETLNVVAGTSIAADSVLACGVSGCIYTINPTVPARVGAIFSW